MTRTIALATVLIAGLVALLSITDGVSAKPKFTAGKVYCSCTCTSSTYAKDLHWEKVAHCSLNGRACKVKNPYTNQLESGTLSSCMTCQSERNDSLLCSASGLTIGPGGDTGGGPVKPQISTPAPNLQIAP